MTSPPTTRRPSRGGRRRESGQRGGQQGQFQDGPVGSRRQSGMLQAQHGNRFGAEDLLGIHDPAAHDSIGHTHRTVEHEPE